MELIWKLVQWERLILHGMLSGTVGGQRKNIYAEVAREAACTSSSQLVTHTDRQSYH